MIVARPAPDVPSAVQSAQEKREAVRVYPVPGGVAVEWWFSTTRLVKTNFGEGGEMRTKAIAPVALPPDTVSLKEEVVPAIRDLLGRGLSETFMKSCVRVGAFTQFGGGLKSDLVGGLRVDVHAVLKLGDKELRRHKTLMEAVNRARERTFPMVLHVAPLERGRMFLLMEELRGHVTLADKVYVESTSLADLARILSKVFQSLRVIHGFVQGTDTSLDCLPTTREPFAARLASRLKEVVEIDPAMAEMFHRPGEVMGRPCPPIANLLARAKALAKHASRAILLRLVHGDPHLGNVMVRRSGTTGYSVRLIDPNSEIGFSQPVYDIAKLLHWAGPAGWAARRPEFCRVTWRPSTKQRGWQLRAWCHEVPERADQRRRCVEEGVRRFAKEYSGDYGDGWPAILAIATASADAGLAARLKGDDHCTTRRFALAHTLDKLASLEADTSQRAPR